MKLKKSEHSWHRPVMSKIGEWLHRYVPSEIAGITTAYLGFWYVMQGYGHHTGAAYASAISENFGFYGIILFRDFFSSRKVAKLAGETFGAPALLALCAGLLVEFGPAELVDSLVVRPLTIGVATTHLGMEWGVLVGKLAADVSFFVPTILIYEWKKKYLKKHSFV